MSKVKTIRVRRGGANANGSHRYRYSFEGLDLNMGEMKRMKKFTFVFSDSIQPVDRALIEKKWEAKLINLTYYNPEKTVTPTPVSSPVVPVEERNPHLSYDIDGDGDLDEK